ncbi:MAG: AAA family ATPase [Acidimicrobiaceae bacterium]|nr:AAA family ATPase [Acidimicrobiaceae bacterium]
MRLHRVRLRNFRGVADSEVEFSAEGVTVVEGPNEVGKTSIPEALDLLLEMLDSSSARKVKSVKPVGRDVGPEAEIEMSSGDYRFVYAKRWLRDRYTTLEVTSPRHEQLTGRGAHDRVRAILYDTMDRNLWAALRIDQGEQLALPRFGETSLGQALDRAAGGQFASDREDDLWDRIRAERDRYWTARGQPVKDRKSRDDRIRNARTNVEALAAGIEAIDSDASEVSRLAADESRLAGARADCEQQERELSEEWDATGHLRKEAERLATADEAATAKREGAARDWQRRDELVRDHESRVRNLAELESQAERAAPALAAAAKHATQAASSLDEARTALRSAENQQRTANADRDHRRQEIEVAQLTERRDRVIAAETTLTEAEAHLESAKVDNDLLDRIDEANLAVERAKAAFDSGAASMETTALRDLSARIGGEDVDLATGESYRTVVGVEAELSIPDVAVVRVRSGAGSKDLSAERARARDALLRLCEAGGVADLDEARRAAHQRSEAERQRSDALETIERDLRDLTVDTLRSKIEALNRRIGAYAQERSDDPPLPPDFEEAKKIASDAERLIAQRQAEFEARDAAAATASEVLGQEQLKEAELSGQIKSAHSAEQLADEHLATARDELADADIAADLVAATQGAEAAGQSLAEAEAKLKAADPDSIEIKLDNARQAVLRASEDLRSNRERQIELRSRLEVRGEEGLHTRHDEATSRLQHLERERDGTEARAEAARMLHDTFERRRQQARQRYMEPFKQRIEQLGRIVFNETFAVELDDDLSIVRRTLDGDTLNVDQLSTGALEQIGVISRLACAAIVSPDGGGAPVIIDDALGWSDPDRLRNMGAAISAAGGQCQVIILTCTPGRYARVGNATTIRLPSDS